MQRPRGAAEGRDHVKQSPHIPACYLCRAAHVACGPERPCQQCVRKGRADHCCDPPPRKKGRPARNDPRYRSKHAPPPPEAPQPQPPTGVGRADDEVVLLLVEEVVRLRRELQAAQLELERVRASTSAEMEEGAVGWRKRPRLDGPVVASSSSTVAVAAEAAESEDDGEIGSALREARIRMPFLRQYRLGPDRPFVVSGLFEKPVLVAEKQSSGQLVCTYANEAFANLFQFTSRDVGRSVGSVSACHPNQRAIPLFRTQQEPWSVSDILAVSRLMRGMDNRLWRVAANLQLFFDQTGHCKYTIAVLQHWEAGQLQPGEVFDTAPPPSPLEVSSASDSSQPRTRPPEDDGFLQLGSAISDEDFYGWMPQVFTWS